MQDDMRRQDGRAFELLVAVGYAANTDPFRLCRRT
jgi:hypothetical protein